MSIHFTTKNRVVTETIILEHRIKIPPTAITGQWTLFVRLVKQSIVGRKLELQELYPCAVKTSSSSLANVAFSFSESVNDMPDAAMREPENAQKHAKIWLSIT